MTTTQIVLSVTQLTSAIKLHLEKQFSYLVVQGEISNFKKQVSNHLYFTLKDQHAQIQCVMFSSDARALKKLPANGDQVQIKGEISVYPPRGNYQIIVRSLQPTGLGALLLELEERKAKYLKLGWFDPNHKKPLPKFPKTIGVVTSATGAVISDILQILSRRAAGFHVILNPVKVQGEGAAQEISQAIDDFNRYQLADLLIVGRGGGSMEDLWAFNEECVIRSIYESKLPVITAIGHETDTTLSDLVADLRAPTPSAAAELATEENEKLQEKLALSQKRLDQLLLQDVKVKKQALERILRHPFLQAPEKMLRVYDQMLDEKKMKLHQIFLEKLHSAQTRLHDKKLALQMVSPQTKIKENLFKLMQLQNQFDQFQKLKLQSYQSKFEKLKTHLDAINPKKVLEKGYSILFDEKKKTVIVSTQDISLKQNVNLVLRDGSVKANVLEVKPGEPHERSKL